MESYGSAHCSLPSLKSYAGLWQLVQNRLVSEEMDINESIDRLVFSLRSQIRKAGKLY